MTNQIVIVDYWSGNLASVMFAVRGLGYSAGVARSPEEIRDARVLIIPGVGNAISAGSVLESTWLSEALHLRHSAERPVVGICLGAQLMYTRLDESDSAGLSWLSGSVEELPNGHRNTGWSSLDHQTLRETRLATGIRPDDTFYFNHRYALPRRSATIEVLSADTSPVVAIAISGHLYAIQFHPEKSQAPGARLLQNTLRVADAN